MSGYPYPLFTEFDCIDRCSGAHGFNPATHPAEFLNCILNCRQGHVDTNPPPADTVQLQVLNTTEFASMTKCLTLASGACTIIAAIAGGSVVAVPGAGVVLVVPAGVTVAQFCLATSAAFCIARSGLMKPRP